MDDYKINHNTNEKNVQNNNILFLTYNNSIEFINQIEKIYINNKNLEEQKLSQLNNYKNKKSKEYLKVIYSIPKTSLSSLIFKQGIIITSMTIKKNNIYIGTNKGEIRVYNWKTEKKLNYLINSEISHENKRDVICMDASDDNKILVVGHLNGYILLWDIQTSESKKLIKEEFDTQIVAIKFTLVENGFYEFLASDLKGSVKRLGLNEGFFFNSVNSNYVIDYTQPIFIIEVLQLTKEQKNIIYKYNNNSDQEEPLIVAFGSLDFVFIVQLEPEIKRLYNFKKPNYIKGSFVPDVCFGQGKIPAPDFYSKDFSEEEIKKILDNSKKKDLTEKYGINPNLDYSKNYQLIFVSWGKIINIFMISFDFNDFLSINLVGYYINNESIIRMGVLSSNIIYILDIYKKFKILNTSFMNQGEIKLDSERNIIYKNSNKAELCSEFPLDHEILFQTYIPDINSENRNIYKSTFNNLVISQEKNIFAVCKKNIYLGCLLNWEQCIEELFKNLEWLNAFKLGIDIYHGKNKILYGIPEDKKNRKEKVKKILKGLILQLISNTINTKGIFYNEKKTEEILSNCINVSIELSLDLNELDFLLKEILPKLEEKGYFDFFIEKIKPFILEKKITNEQLGQNIMSKILNYYINLNDYITLSQIIINIDIKNFDIKEIKDICIKKNIIFPLIYINFKTSENEDLFLLIEKIYELFKKANSISKEKYEKYKNDIITNKISNNEINEIQLTKQYIGQKILWFIFQCLKGKKYPTKEIIDEKVYINLIQKIFLWLIKDEISNELLIFDSYSYFYILSKFFINDILFDNIKNISYENNKKIFDGIIYNGKNLEKIDIEIIIEILYKKINSIKNILINDDFEEFILKISSTKQILPSNYIINSINYFINFKTKNEERLKTEDYFGYHCKELDINEKIEKYSNDINIVLKNYKLKLEKKQLNNILILADKNEFPLVCIKILQLLNDNIKCLDVYLDNNKIKNKQDKIFRFIDEFMEKSSEEEENKYKKELITRIGKLAELSIDRLINMSLKWLNEEQLTVIEKLSSNNEIKLKYIKEYLNYYKENNINDEKDKIYLKESDYYKILIIHIETLSKTGQKKDIINLLKEEPAYLNDDCLKVCLRNNILDAALYIYIHQENFAEALSLCKKEITSNIDKLIKFYTEENKEYQKAELFSEHDELINNCCYICQKESDQLSKKERKKIWFEILEFLYNKIEIINKKQKKAKINLNEVKSKISDDINNFILKMYPYIDMKSLMAEIYKKTEMTEFKGINNILNSFVKEQIIYKNIFNKIKSIIDYSIINNYKEKNKNNKKGINYKLEYCDFCHKKFNDEDYIILLNCGHITHKNNNCCIIVENQYNSCKICYDKKLEESIGSFDIENNINLDLNNDIKINDVKNKNEKKDDNNLKESLDKLNYIEEQYKKINSIIDINIKDIKCKKNKDKKLEENKKNS